ncbi:MAG TPA: bifunctional oligoribonuclease/PAP phosphatase NrnA [Tepidisphaeraceae bacterium]|jgi:phosphoesterase RecJ-like protein|nr:bifunctional oligoribonuclease/PAP phosphatase NrnA [Tepidisphaeraceae bacterium]
MPDSYQDVIDKLRPAKKVLITTHVRPDGDALGSSAAMALGLRKIKIDSEILLLSHLPRKYSFLFNDHGLSHIEAEPGIPSHLNLDHYDALLVVDTGTWSQLPGLSDRITKWPKPKIVLDHHLTQEQWADVKLVDSSAAAAGEIVAELLDRWKIPLDRSIATTLYVAIVSDTGWFQFSNTRAQTLRLAAGLIEAGADTEQVRKALNESERPERLALQTRAQQSLQLLADASLAIMTLQRVDFEQTKASPFETENFINFPLQIKTVIVSAFIVERGPKEIRISLRSKGLIDVALFAQRFGGGGHSRASAYTFEGDLAAAKAAFTENMTRELATVPQNV